MNFKFLLFTLLIATSIGLGSCAEEKEGCTNPKAENYDKDAKKDNGSCIQLLDLPQSLLDITNAAYGSPHSGIYITNQDGGAEDTFKVVHGGSKYVRADSTVRVIFTNFDLKNEDAKPGDLIVKRTYLKDFATGRPDWNKLITLNALYKQTKGYNPQYADWEYFIIDGNTVSTEHPNGLLPPTRDNKNRGKITFCYGCHIKGGADYMLYR